MAEPLKNIYTKSFVTQLCSSWKKVLPELNEDNLQQFIFKGNWNDLELKERMSRLADAMKLGLPKEFPKAAPMVKKMIHQLHADGLPVSGFQYMFIPEYVEKNGINNLELSLDALKHITQFTSCEFAIRPFIQLHEKESMEFMLHCSLDKHENVRRFASEGCRSRLPWAMSLPSFKKDASLILPILENLKQDHSLFVRKSVANNLNDISKDHPELALNLAKKWKGNSAKTDWMVKHGMRTLLKAGNPVAMSLFNYAEIENLENSDFQITTPSVEFGEHLTFQLQLKNKTKKEQIVRLEFAIYFLRNNGLQSKKVFKISERKLKKLEIIHISKAHAIKPISTRKYYPGKHSVSLIVNGVEFEKHDFLLNM